MKSTGITRQIDGLGRVVIPKEIRRTLGLKEGDYLEIFVEEESVIFRRYDKTLPIKEELRRLKNGIMDCYDKQSTDRILPIIEELERLVNEVD